MMKNNYYETFIFTLKEYLEKIAKYDESVFDFHQSDTAMFASTYAIVSGKEPTSFIQGLEINELWCNYVVPYFRHCGIGESLDEEDIEEIGKEFFIKYLNILFRTYPKYKVLLDNYKAEESNLMNGIKTESTIEYGRVDSSSYSPELNTITSGSITNADNTSHISQSNNTPQVAEDFSTEQGYTSELKKDTSEDSHTQTFNNYTVSQTGNSNNINNASGSDISTIIADGTTKMAKLSEIHEKWRNIYTQWMREFNPLFTIL